MFEQDFNNEMQSCVGSQVIEGLMVVFTIGGRLEEKMVAGYAMAILNTSNLIWFPLFSASFQGWIRLLLNEPKEMA